jgi:hypothetical protein
MGRISASKAHSAARLKKLAHRISFTPLACTLKACPGIAVKPQLPKRDQGQALHSDAASLRGSQRRLDMEGKRLTTHHNLVDVQWTGQKYSPNR